MPKMDARAEVTPRGYIVEFDHPFRGLVKVTVEMEEGEMPGNVAGPQLTPEVEWACAAPLPRRLRGRDA